MSSVVELIGNLTAWLRAPDDHLYMRFEGMAPEFGVSLRSERVRVPLSLREIGIVSL